MHTKKAKPIREKRNPRYAHPTEESPYRDWLQTRRNFRQDDEPAEANPDVLPSAAAMWQMSDAVLSDADQARLTLMAQLWPTLTKKQQKIIQLVCYEGRTFENTAALLNISKSTVQTTLDRIRERVREHDL